MNTILTAYEGNSVIMRHEQDERRRNILDAEARDQLALEDDGPTMKNQKITRLETKKPLVICDMDDEECFGHTTFSPCDNFYPIQGGKCGHEKENI